MDECLRGKMRSPWMNGWMIVRVRSTCMLWMDGGCMRVKESMDELRDEWMRVELRHFLGFCFSLLFSFCFPFSLLSCLVRCCACLLLSPLLFSSLLPTPLLLFESSSSRNINSLLLFLVQERSPKSSGFCRVFVCVQKQARKKKM